ncbi:hypothetical protein D3C84_797140 [compost metagenome]
MEQGRAQPNDGKDFQREDDFLDIVDICKDERGGPVDTLGKQVKHQETCKEDKPKLSFGVTASSPSGFEDDTEDEGVDDQHQHGIEE